MRLAVLFLVVLTLGSCATLTGQMGRGYRDDANVTAAVRAALAGDENLSSGAQIGVDTNQGNVHLVGAVGSEIERLRAAAVARKVAGVFKVTNSLHVAGDRAARGQDES